MDNNITMIKRTILDQHSEVIGYLELPSDTPEDVWKEQLDLYNNTIEQRELT